MGITAQQLLKLSVNLLKVSGLGKTLMDILPGFTAIIVMKKITLIEKMLTLIQAMQEKPYDST